jgi:hypothetical protein
VKAKRRRALAAAGCLAALLGAALWAAGAGAAADGGPTASHWLTRARVDMVKASVATAATLLLVGGLALRRSGRPAALARTRDLLLLGLGAAGALCWTNLGQLHQPNYVHVSDTFHYYVGAKYFQELGYRRLYACTAVADAEAGLAAPGRARPLRDLETNRPGTTGAILRDPESCLRHFSPARWAAFRRDVARFRGRVSPARWWKIQSDHGYNATPAWGVLGVSLANATPPGWRSITALTLIDPVLLVLMWGTVVWAFGWRIACIGLVYWGTNHPAPFSWTGGSYLRHDWLVASVVGICLLRRDRTLLGGFLLGTAALLRVFPIFLLGAVALRAALVMARNRRFVLDRAQRRIALGAALAVALIVPLSAVVTGGARSWLEFADVIQLQRETPMRNHLGLRTALVHAGGREASATTSIEAWKREHGERYEALRPVFFALVAAFAVLLACALARGPNWSAAVLGIGLVPIALELTSYYYALLLGYALLSKRHESVGAGLCGLAALSWAVVERRDSYESVFAATSVAVVTFVVLVTVLIAWRPQGDDEARDSE